MTAPVPGPEIPPLLLVVGPSGAGRSTALRALEDLGFEAIHGLPMAFLPRLARMGPHDRPLALGLDVGGPDHGAPIVGTTPERLGTLFGAAVEVIFLDAPDEVLLRRYSETRRPHPLAPDGPPPLGTAIARGLRAPPPPARPRWPARCGHGQRAGAARAASGAGGRFHRHRRAEPPRAARRDR